MTKDELGEIRIVHQLRTNGTHGQILDVEERRLYEKWRGIDFVLLLFTALDEAEAKNVELQQRLNKLQQYENWD